MRCPDCGTDNIEGVDACEECGAGLAGLDLPEASRGFGGRLLNDRLGDLDLSTPVEVSSSAPVLDAIEGMRRQRCGCTMVVDDGALVGIFDERDVLSRVARPGIDPAKTPMSRVMSPNPLRLSAEDPPAYAVHCMVAYNFRHLAVVEGERLVGYVSVRNVLNYIDS